MSRFAIALRASLRQLRFPREFRIPPPETESALLRDSERVLQELLRLHARAEPGQDDTGGSHERFLVQIATGLWRLQQRLIDPATGEPREDMRRAYRHFETVWDTLAEHGLEIQDHTGEGFDSGMALSVLSFEHDSAMTREIIRETVKPTIYLRNSCIQRGEVIVATPEEEGGEHRS